MQQRTRLWTMVGCTYTHLTSLCHGHPALALCPILATPQKMSDTPLPGTIYLNQPGPGLYLNQRPVTIYLNQSGPGLYSIREFKTHLLTPFYLFLLINIFCNKNLFFVYRLSNSVHKGMKHGWPEEQTDAGCGESALMSRVGWTASWRHTRDSRVNWTAPDIKIEGDAEEGRASVVWCFLCRLSFPLRQVCVCVCVSLKTST